MDRLRRLVPILAWLPRYRRADLPGDLTAGLTTAVMLIPQAMAYAMLAGLPPIVGLYAAIAPPIVYAVFGSCGPRATGIHGPTLLVLAAVALLLVPRPLPRQGARGRRAGDRRLGAARPARPRRRGPRRHPGRAAGPRAAVDLVVDAPRARARGPDDRPALVHGGDLVGPRGRRPGRPPRRRPRAGRPRAQQPRDRRSCAATRSPAACRARPSTPRRGARTGLAGVFTAALVAVALLVADAAAARPAEGGARGDHRRRGRRPDRPRAAARRCGACARASC
jgi:hypothetical protein